MEPIKAWHFITPDMKLRDGTKVSVGSITEVKGKPIPERWGLHASTEAMHALFWANGLMLCEVELSGDIVFGEKKVVSTRREILKVIDAAKIENIIWGWASICANNIINNNRIPVEFISVLKETANIDINPKRLTYLKSEVRKIYRKIHGLKADGSKNYSAVKMPDYLQVLSTICLSKVYYEIGLWWRGFARRPPSWNSKDEEQLLEKMLNEIS